LFDSNFVPTPATDSNCALCLDGSQNDGRFAILGLGIASTLFSNSVLSPPSSPSNRLSHSRELTLDNQRSSLESDNLEGALRQSRARNREQRISNARARAHTTVSQIYSQEFIFLTIVSYLRIFETNVCIEEIIGGLPFCMKCQVVLWIRSKPNA